MLLTCCAALITLLSSCLYPSVWMCPGQQQHPISPVAVRMPSEITSTCESAATHAAHQDEECVFDGVCHISTPPCFYKTPVVWAAQWGLLTSTRGDFIVSPGKTAAPPPPPLVFANHPKQQTNMAPFEKSMEMMPFKQRKCLGESHACLASAHWTHPVWCCIKHSKLFLLRNKKRWSLHHSH